MRQIKFRAWATYGEMLANIQNHIGDGPWAFGKMLNRPDDFSIMQFTGLLDANGKEVYEGDIIARTDDHNLTQIVTWGKNSHWRGMADGYNVHHIGFSVSEYFFSIDNFVVVGNIYQHPELLK